MIRIVVLVLASLFSSASCFYFPVATYSSLEGRRAVSFEANGVRAFASLNQTGHPVAYRDHCPHRGASFDNAPIKNDTFACPYHDFRFDVNDGRLVSGLGVAPGCARLAGLPCVVRDDLVWASLDGDVTEVPPQLPQRHDASYRRISGSVKIRCDSRALVENVLDNLHVSTVHTFGNRDEPTPIDYTAARLTDTHGLASFRYMAGKNSLFDGELVVTNWYHLPSTAGTMVANANKNVKIVQVHAVQRADGVTEVFWELLRNFMIHPIFDGFFRLAMGMTLDEDRRILEKCVPERGDAFHSKYDRLQLLYRRALKSRDPHTTRTTPNK